MERSQAIKQILRNSFVYAREPTQPSGHRVVEVGAGHGPHQQYYKEVMAYLRESLEATPTDLLEAACATRSLPTGEEARPLAIVVCEGAAEGLSPKEQLIFNDISRQSRSLLQLDKRYKGNGIYDSNVYTSAKPGKLHYRNGIVMLNFWQEMHDSGYDHNPNKSVVHELAHHYLAQLPPKEYQSFLAALKKAIKQDRKYISPAIFDEGEHGSKEEYYTWLVEQLCGGTSVFHALESPETLFDLRRCKHVLDVISSHHPTWTRLIAQHNPRQAMRNQEARQEKDWKVRGR